MNSEYDEDQKDVLRGRLEAKINNMNARRWVLEEKEEDSLNKQTWSTMREDDFKTC